MPDQRRAKRQDRRESWTGGMCEAGRVSVRVLSVGEMRRDKPWLNTEMKATAGAVRRTRTGSGAETKCCPG